MHLFSPVFLHWNALDALLYHLYFCIIFDVFLYHFLYHFLHHFCCHLNVFHVLMYFMLSFLRIFLWKNGRMFFALNFVITYIHDIVKRWIIKPYTELYHQWVVIIIMIQCSALLIKVVCMTLTSASTGNNLHSFSRMRFHCN